MGLLWPVRLEDRGSQKKDDSRSRLEILEMIGILSPLSIIFYTKINISSNVSISSKSDKLFSNRSLKTTVGLKSRVPS